MSNQKSLEDRFAELQAEVRQLKAKQPKPPKPNSAWFGDIEQNLHVPSHNRLQEELDKNERAREFKDQDRVIAAFRKTGAEPGRYDVHQLARAGKALGYNTLYSEGKIKAYLKREAEKSETSEGPEKPEK